MGKLFNILVGISLLAGLILPIKVEAQDTLQPQVLVTSIKLGGVVSGEPTEYVELTNITDKTISITNWTLEYAKPTTKITDCENLSWESKDNTSAEKTYLLNGEILAGQTVVIEVALNDNSGGSLHLTDGVQVMDLVGWGNSVSSGVCKESQLANIPNNGDRLNRKLSKEGLFIDTNNNFDDFISSNAQNKSGKNSDGHGGTANPGVVNFCSDDICENDEVAQNNMCNNIELSEVVPNPAGSDTGNEYVELYNSSSLPVDLTGCVLKIGASTKQLTGVVQPGYNAYYGLTLPNASGTTLELITATTEESVTYPADMKDGQSWSLVNGQWQISDQSTPATANIIYMTPDAQNQNSSAASDNLEPCAEGKYRNPETNRCKTIEVEGVLSACQAGQIRNPETNRCKKAVALLSSLKACSAGQVRNPDTNRCRKVGVVASLAACKIGQERNPETNRCRKVAGAVTASANDKNSLNQDLKKKQNISYGVFMAMAVLVFGYGIYEYRDNIANFFAKIKTKSTS